LVLDVSWLAASDLQAIWPNGADGFTPGLRDHVSAPADAVGLDARQENHQHLASLASGLNGQTEQTNWQR
jgi:hypothetical protein